jgi:hypothetical protein
MGCSAHRPVGLPCQVDPQSRDGSFRVRRTPGPRGEVGLFSSPRLPRELQTNRLGSLPRIYIRTALSSQPSGSSSSAALAGFNGPHALAESAAASFRDLLQRRALPAIKHRDRSSPIYTPSETPSRSHSRALVTRRRRGWETDFAAVDDSGLGECSYPSALLGGLHSDHVEGVCVLKSSTGGSRCWQFIARVGAPPCTRLEPWPASTATPIHGMKPSTVLTSTPPYVTPVSHEFWGPGARAGLCREWRHCPWWAAPPWLSWWWKTRLVRWSFNHRPRLVEGVPVQSVDPPPLMCVSMDGDWIRLDWIVTTDLRSNGSHGVPVHKEVCVIRTVDPASSGARWPLPLRPTALQKSPWLS